MNGFRSETRLSLAAVVAAFICQGQAAVNISGIVVDSAGAPIASAAINLETTGGTATSGVDGKFTLTGATPIVSPDARSAFARLHDGAVFLSVPEPSAVTITAFGAQGRELVSSEKRVAAGSQSSQRGELSGNRLLPGF